jgi:hypothetical protein
MTTGSSGETYGVFLEDTVVTVPPGPALTVRISWR